VTVDECFSVYGGSYFVAPADCSTPCEPLGACCRPDGGCQIITEGICTGFFEGTYAGDNVACDVDTCVTGCTANCGDLDANGGPVSLVDFTTFAVCFGLPAPTGSCPADTWACADLNADGVINLVDFTTIATIFGTVVSAQPPDCLGSPRAASPIVQPSANGARHRLMQDGRTVYVP
jgi:hypothetical protein